MREIENEKPIVFVEGDEDKVVIEKCDYDTSLFSAQYTKRLAEMNDDCVNISDDIYVNLTEETKKGLFANQAVDQGMKYYHSQLINLRMRRWVAEHS